MIDTPVSVVVRTQCSIRTDVSRFKWKALVGTYHDHESFTIFKSRRFTFRMILKNNIRIILFFISMVILKRSIVFPTRDYMSVWSVFLGRMWVWAPIVAGAPTAKRRTLFLIHSSKYGGILTPCTYNSHVRCIKSRVCCLGTIHDHKVCWMKFEESIQV